ncbi:MAG: hypothetical protein JW759_09625 [Candidatus Coatesbacteria bacterium]|nr:hypothetical protein [Candidatus Coatesbacteria bacterium]
MAKHEIDRLEEDGQQIRHLVVGFASDKSRGNQDDNWLIITQSIVGNIQSLVPRSVIDRANAFLTRLAETAGRPGAKVFISDELHRPWAYARDKAELISYLEYLHEAGFLRWFNPACGVSPRAGEHKITVQGWRHLEELRKPNLKSEKGFVAMSFNKANDDLKNLRDRIIEPAIAHAGYYPVRIDREYVDKIDDGIIVNIRESRFMVADFTEQKQNVYYEAGFARGFGVKVVSMCSQDEIEKGKLHFDTRQYRHIPWKPDQLEDGSEELKELLRTLS